MTQITITATAYQCRECYELFNTADWRWQYELKSNEYEKR